MKLSDHKELMLLKQSQAGKILLESLRGDVMSLIGSILRDYKTIQHIELQTLISQLQAKNELMDLLENSELMVDLLSKEEPEEDK